MINQNSLKMTYADTSVAHRNAALGSDAAFKPVCRVRSRSAHRQKPLTWSDIEGVVLTVVAVLTTAYLVHCYGAKIGPFAAAPSVTKTVSVTVAPGDTAWALAGKYESSALSADQRLERVRQANPGIDLSRPLRPGMKLSLPATE